MIMFFKRTLLLRKVQYVAKIVHGISPNKVISVFFGGIFAIFAYED